MNASADRFATGVPRGKSVLLSDGIQDTQGVTDTRMSLIPADLARHFDVKVSSFASFSQ
jgi:hypothetical protein